MLGSRTAQHLSQTRRCIPAVHDPFFSLLIRVGVLIISLSAAAFLLCAIPALWAFIRVAYRTEAVLEQVERELPETAALIRLSGLEVTDCVAEITGLGSDLSSGLRSTANMATMTETGVRQSVQGVQVIGQQMGPAFAAQESQARDVLEAELQRRAQLNYAKPLLSQLATSAASTTSKVRKMRLGWKTFNLGIAARAFVNRHAQRIAQGKGTSHQSSSSVPRSRYPNDPDFSGSRGRRWYGSAAVAGSGAGSTAARPVATDDAAPAPTVAATADAATAAPAPPAAAAAIKQQQEQQGGVGSGARRRFMQDELKTMTKGELKELCKTCNLKSTGNKDELIQRIVEHQQRVRRAS
ncbi:hypothetical protein DUNSADRAFT_1728 [Dunaliella salina]|uniref:SAP domain-containing protein n=1 Tax=Dunaliella salina TaxID=3046 RepID=A0ABQ7GWP1_DUNSA|nr:hypothetical protein DUNSADRAFT_1728 [Dunaliella salina]|eukprot:KAF5839031.1 hypothetical protein DUNSADRAFT_1728 [Dunaliella salina]